MISVALNDVFKQAVGYAKISHSHAGSEAQSETAPKEETLLDQFTMELVSLAQSGKIDPVIGRSEEIERVMQTLCRRKKNNPLLVGERYFEKCKDICA